MRRNSRLLNEPYRIATGANLVSVARVLLVPIATATVYANNHAGYLLCVLAICASDVLDGIIARATGTAGPLGALVDVVADGVAVFALQIVLLLQGHWPLHVLASSATAYALFLVCARRDRAVRRRPFGRYAGAAVMGLLALPAVLDLIAPGLWEHANQLIALPVSLYAAGAAVETLIRRAANQRAWRHDAPLPKKSRDYTWVAASGLSQVHKL